MNNTGIKGLRGLWASCEDKKGGDNYCLRDNNGMMIIGWISEMRAREYQIYYKNSTIEKMPQ